MSTVNRFEDLIVWQKARALVKEIYQATKDCKDYGFTDQIRRAAVSVMSNISEGFSRRSNKEFIQFLFIAKASVAEVQSDLYVALDQGYVKRDKFDVLYQQADKVARLISNFLTYLLKHNKHN